MLRVCDLTQQPSHVVQTPAMEFPFTLDVFQTHAISAIDQQHNVLCCAKTGSGKTLLAEYAIAHARKQGKRVFYTTPIKSLSNQKFHDLKQMWSAPGEVGIMTGDCKYCPDAQIVIMTTEILRNLLYKQGTVTEHVGLTASLSLDNLGAVIFDECHYINDPDRGKIWEETMILLPPSVQLICLSATLDRPEAFAEWLGTLKQVPCHCIQTQFRVVPLTHTVLQNDTFHTIMDAKEVFYDGVYNDWLLTRSKTEKEHEAFQKKVQQARRSGHEGPIGGKIKPVSYQHQLNECIRTLERRNLLPALCFVLSRKGCEQFAARTESTLLDSSDSAAARTIFDFHLRHHLHTLETLPQYHSIRELIQRGLAYHHSGVLPILKEIIEILFTKGFIKLLYCTETFAVGINMPTKTVIFTGLSKYDDHTGGMRYLRTDELTQMAGRAGRRGKDPVGTVIYLLEREPPTVYDMRTILKGGRPQIKSRMDFHYDFLLKTYQTSHTKWMDIQTQSYWYRQQRKMCDAERANLAKLTQTLAATGMDDEMIAEMKQFDELQLQVQIQTNKKRREAQLRLDRWKDSHVGPRWSHAQSTWKTIQSLQKEIEQSKLSLEQLESNKGSADIWIQCLQRTGFIQDDHTLSKKGVLATEFNEGHGLLSAECLTRGAMKGLSAEECLAVFACFLEEKETDATPSFDDLQVSQGVKQTLTLLDTIVGEFQAVEESFQTLSPESYWRLTTTWIEPIIRWVRGEEVSQICAEYDLFTGNFQRAVLRVANIVDEWIAVATFLEDVQLVEVLHDCRPKLVRGCVIPDSLYIHL